ncbi:MAG: hypothetical protein HWN81_04035 [Candidatus Lokiarchaeota archaeon]|nr:hypothetical protein [Candidatus Lokiarchaeota archaeon]
MTTAEEEIIFTIKGNILGEVEEELNKVLEEAKEKLGIEVGKIIIKKEPLDPIDKKRAEKRWKQSIGYYQLNPHQFNFGFRDFKQKKLKRF